ncbi:MAG: alanine--glyoxylate aminotransferase family protein [Chloroflexi bacterium]|nr:alanine--glyoxylate aminotransferase family protein [Chloroflexota bacterium]
MNLRIPGPTPCPPEVLQAMTQQMINHRGPEFAKLLEKTTANLQSFFQTKEDVLILTTAGSGGLESAVVNTLSPGDKVLAVTVGVFGDRFAQIAEAYGADVTRLKFTMGGAADPVEVRRALAADPSVKAVLLTQNETSTGVTNDMKALCSVIKEFDKLLLVDAVSGLAAIDLPVDAWNCDVVVAGSQKSWMIPPGLAMVSVSKKAWDAAAKAKMSRFYFDYGSAKKYLERGQTPFTPAVSLFYALDAALALMEQEGLASIFARHVKMGQYTRDGVRSLGLELFADPRYASNTVTAVKVPDGVDGKALTKVMREQFGIVLAGGQASLEGKIFRIGHLGYVSTKDIDDVMSALPHALRAAGSGRAEAVKTTGS